MLPFIEQSRFRAWSFWPFREQQVEVPFKLKEDVASKATQERAAAARQKMPELNQSFWKNREKRLKGQTLARKLFHQEEFRCPETIRQLSEDLELAEETVKAFVTYFKFGSMSVTKALRSFLKVLWPVDEPELQHLFITHFSHRFLVCTGQSLALQTAVRHLCWAMIRLNADFNSHYKKPKKICERFIESLNSGSCSYECCTGRLKRIFRSIKSKPLEMFCVKANCHTTSNKEISVADDSGCNPTFRTDNDPTSTVFKTGKLICKRVADKNGRKTRICQRAWTPCTAVLKGMKLDFKKYQFDLCEADSKNAIKLHHAFAYPVDHKTRPHVLCLKTADSGVFLFEAESKVEQDSWVAIINRIAARFSAPPLTPVSRDIKACCPQLLPTFPTPLSLEQQLEFHKDQLRKVSELMAYYLTLTSWDQTLDYLEQEMKRLTTYVKVLEELV